jgi:hypothetical protein
MYIPLLGFAYVLLFGWRVGYLLMDSLHWNAEGNAGVMHYIAWRIGEGAVPYRDIVESNFPGTYLLYMLCHTLFGNTDIGFRLFDLTFCALIGAAFMALTWASSRLYAVAGWLVFVYIHLCFGAKSMAERDFLMLPFILFSAYSLKRWLESHRRGWMLLLGVLDGYALWIKPYAVVFAALAAAAIWLEALPRRERLYAIISIGLGSLLPTLLILSWLSSLGALRPFLEMQTTFNMPVYSKYHATTWDGWHLAESILSMVYCMGLSYELYRTSLARSIRMVIGLGLIYGSFHYYLQHRAVWYYAYPSLAFICLYGALVGGAPGYGARFGKRGIGHCIVLCGLWLYFSPVQETAIRIDGKNDRHMIPAMLHIAGEDAQAALDAVPVAIKESYAARYPGKPIQPLGFTLWNVAWRQHWVAPSRYTYAYPVYMQFRSAEVDKVAGKIYEEVSRTVPLVILVEEDKVFYHIIDTVSPWREFMSAHYVLIKMTDYYRLYARNK